MNEEKIYWRTREYIYREKSADWYWIVSIVTVSIALISIILNNIIFAILVLVSSFTLSVFASKKPDEVSAEINEKGITVNKTHYPYIHLDSFWVEDRDAHPRLILKSKKKFIPLIVILVDQNNITEIKQKLINHLPEEEHTEPLLQKLFIYLGF